MSVSEKDIKKIIFSNARTYNDWQRKGVSNKILNELYDLMKLVRLVQIAHRLE